MNKKKSLLTKLGIGLVVVGVPASFGLAAITSPRYKSSNYLSEKGYIDCKDKCSDLAAGYDWARNNNVCDPYYNKGISNSYNIGVQAWAWDECAYSRDGKPI